MKNTKKHFKIKSNYLFVSIIVFSCLSFITSNKSMQAQTFSIPDIGQDSIAIIIEQSVNEAKQFYENLDHSGMQSSLLFNYGFLILNDLEAWNDSVPVMTNLFSWKHILSGIKHSLFNDTLELPDFCTIVDSNTVQGKYASSLVGLSILYFRGDYLPDTVIKEMINTNDFSDPAYQTMSIFSGTTLLQNVYNGTVYYHYAPNLLFSNINNEINQLWVDFEDGSGYRFLDKDLEQTFVVNYSTIGEKSIKFKVITDIDTLISYSKMNISSTYLQEPDFFGYIDGDDSTFTLFNSNKSTDPENVLNGASYAYFGGCDGVLDKPVIICEGFDVIGSMTLIDLQSSWENTINDLKLNGYDIFLVNIDNPGNNMFENAKIIKTLIKAINSSKQGFFESIYIGESMGGILGRIALKELENDGYNHQVGLYLSYDSPHKGAFIPEGLQSTLISLATSFPVLAYTSYISGLLCDIFGWETNALSLLYTYTSVGARQLIANHICDPYTHQQFQSMLNNLGYPEKTRNIAFSNGSNIATLQSGGGPGDLMYSRQFVFGILNVFMKAWYTEYEPDNQKVSSVTVLKPFIVPFISYWRVSGPYRPYTNAPGGHLKYTIPALLDDPSDIKFTFVPTASALDLAASLWNAGNYNYYNIQYANRNTQALLDNNLTPFDDIYAASLNTPHVNPSSLATEIKKVEMMPVNYYIQNRNLDDNTDFEATNFINSGKDVDDQIYYNYPSYVQKNIDEGDVVISNGSTVNFLAVNKIILSDGFTAEDGSVFHAKVGIDVCPENRNPICLPENSEIEITQPSCNQFVATSKNVTGNCFWTLQGENIEVNYSGNEIQFSNLPLGQYTLYCSLDSGGLNPFCSKIIKVQCGKKVETEKQIVKNSDTILTPKFDIYPNPTNGKVNVVPVYLSNSEEYSISIFNENGEVKYNCTSSGVITIDLSGFEPSIYLLNIKAENYESNSKIILH